MTGDFPLALDQSEKLAALQEVDRHRAWRSLDDKRRCLRCGKLITGRTIRIVVNPDGSGPLRGRCPTRRCDSQPKDWALPRDRYVVIPGADEPVLQSPAFRRRLEVRRRAAAI